MHLARLCGGVPTASSSYNGRRLRPAPFILSGSLELAGLVMLFAFI